jgi:hypothetical protein
MNTKTHLAAIVATALVGLSQAQADTMTISSQFTPLENLNAQTRLNIQQKIETEHPFAHIDWEQSLIGMNDAGMLEVRDKDTLRLQLVAQPTCAGTGALR